MDSQEEPRLMFVLPDGREVFDFGNGRVQPVFAGGSDDDDDSKDDKESKDDDDKESKDDDDSKESKDDDDKESKDDDDPKSAKELARARKEAAKYRTERNEERKKTKALETSIAEIKKKLGLSDDDKDDAALEKKLTAKEAELKELKVERAISRAAKKNGADPDALTDSRAFMKQASGLDPDEDDFEDEIASLVKDAVANNPKLKSGQVPDKSGSEFSGGSGGVKQLSREDLKSMSPEEIEKARTEGRLNKIMGA